MRRFLLRLVRDLALIPLIGIVSYEIIAHLPIRRDTGSKVMISQAVQQDTAHRLCLDRWDGFLCPWRNLLEGKSLASDTSVDTYDARQIASAAMGSARIGGMALLLALVLALAFAFARVVFERSPADEALDLWPTLVYATPSFIFAMLVAAYTGVSYGDDKRAFEPIAALVVALGPGTFLGVVLHDALKAESLKPYVQTALAKGRSRLSAHLRHALPNAIPTMLDALPPVATAMLAGSFVAEKLFNVTYLGFMYVEAARDRELQVVVVTTTIFASILVLVSLAVDLARLIIDPLARRRAFEGDR